MKATIVLFVLIAAVVAALAAEPATPAVSAVAAALHATEPVWMVLSGATLLALASVVRRFVP
jgi:hypothetical protein